MSAIISKDGELMSVLDMACRERYQDFQPVLKDWIKSDDNAVRYGELTVIIATRTGLPVDRTRRQLRAAERDGKVLSYKAYEGAVIQWWPVGLLAKVCP